MLQPKLQGNATDFGDLLELPGLMVLQVVMEQRQYARVITQVLHQT